MIETIGIAHTLPCELGVSLYPIAVGTLVVLVDYVLVQVRASLSIHRHGQDDFVVCNHVPDFLEKNAVRDWPNPVVFV